jgi:hypothetical protein
MVGVKTSKLLVMVFYGATLLMGTSFVSAKTKVATTSSKSAYDYAIDDLNTVIANSPGDANAYYDRGLVYMDKGWYDHAIADFTRAIALHPDDAHVYIERAKAWYHQGNYAKAWADVRVYRERCGDRLYDDGYRISVIRECWYPDLNHEGRYVGEAEGAQHVDLITEGWHIDLIDEEFVQALEKDSGQNEATKPTFESSRAASMAYAARPDVQTRMAKLAAVRAADAWWDEVGAWHRVPATEIDGTTLLEVELHHPLDPNFVGQYRGWGSWNPDYGQGSEEARDLVSDELLDLAVLRTMHLPGSRRHVSFLGIPTGWFFFG